MKIKCPLPFILLLFTLLYTTSIFADQQNTFPPRSSDFIQNHASIQATSRWNRFKILIWPYQTDVTIDFDLYEEVGVGGFQIDRGAGKQHLVDFAIANSFPYYVGHAAGKGTLYLTGENARLVTGNTGLIKRPMSLANQDVLESMKSLIIVNNPSEKESLKDESDPGGINGEEAGITLRFDHDVQVTNLRTNKRFPAGVEITDRFKPWEGNLYEVQQVEG